MLRYGGPSGDPRPPEAKIEEKKYGGKSPSTEINFMRNTAKFSRGKF